MKDLAGVRALFQKLGIWEVVRDLSEKEPRGATTQPWHRKAEEFLGMDADKAIDDIVGRRCALIATEPSEWQNGVLLAELDRAEDLKPLLRRWKAEPLSDEGPVKKYVLSGGLMLAAIDRTIALGPPDDPEGLWGRTVLLMSGRRGPSLSGRSEFASLRSRMAGAYQGLLYVTWPDGSGRGVAECSRLLAAGAITSSGIHFEIQGQRIKPRKPDKPCDVGGLAALPDSAIAAMGGTFDFGSLSEQATEDEKHDAISILGFVGTLISNPQPSGSIAQKLGPAYTLIWSTDKSKTIGYEMPAAALVIPSRATPEDIRMLDSSLGIIAQITATFAQRRPSEVEALTVQKEVIEGIEIHFVAVGPIFAERLDLPVLANADLCWCLVNDRFVISTSRQLMKDLIAAHKHPSGNSMPVNGEPAEVFFLRAAPTARMLTSWLNHLEKSDPEMLNETWWRDWASRRMERYTRLGLLLVPDKNSPVRTIVQEIEPSSPAKDFLQVGDTITAIDGRALSTRKPAMEVAQRYRGRGAARKFRVQFLREGKLIDAEIPVQPADPLDLADFEPIRAIRQLIVLTQKVRTVAVWRAVSSSDRLEARVDIRWAE